MNLLCSDAVMNEELICNDIQQISMYFSENQSEKKRPTTELI